MTDYSNLPSLNDLVAMEKMDLDKPRLSICCNEPFKDETIDRIIYDEAWICSKCGEHESNKTIKRRK